MQFIVKKDNIYLLMLSIMLLTPIYFSSLELNTLLALFFLLLFFVGKKPISKGIINTTLPLFIIIILASFQAFFYSPKGIDFFKDTLYFLKPIFFIVLGYYLFRGIKNKSKIFETLIYLGFLCSIIHLSRVILFLTDNPFVVNDIRNDTGLFNYVELLAVVLLTTSLKKYDIYINIKFRKVIKTVIIISFIFYFSRTMFVGYLLLFLSIKGYLKLTTKGVKYITIAALLIISFYTYLFSINLERGSSGLEGFLYKIKIAPSEIFMPDKNIDVRNHMNLWDHWRAYEASRAISQLEGTPHSLGLIFGQGFGALLDLGFEAPLGGERIQYIPKIHNGYIYIMLKSGILGIFIYLLFLVNIYLFSYSKKTAPQKLYLDNMLSGIAVYFFFTSLIINGVYNQGDMFTLVLGGLIFLRKEEF